MEKLWTFSETDFIVGGILVGLFILQLLFLFVVYFRPYRYAKKHPRDTQSENVDLPPVSVIIYAKNESEELELNLPFVLEQDYPEYEVIVINDGSTDETEEILKLLKAKYKHLYYTSIPESVKYLSRRKLALTLGVKAAKHDILLFTEANCYPLSNIWIKTMASNFKPGTDFVLGYCSYGLGLTMGFLNKLITYDRLLSGLQYISAALTKRPYTGDGCNLAYRKEVFVKNKGYHHTLSLHAGDDDLFVNDFATGKNAVVEYSPEGLTEIAVMQYSTWKEMKVSRAATRRHYKGWSLSGYRLDTIFYFLFLIAVITSIVLGVMGNPLLAALGALLYLLLSILRAYVFSKSATMLVQRLRLRYLPLFDVILPLYNLYIRIYRAFRGKKDYTFNILD